MVGLPLQQAVQAVQRLGEAVGAQVALGEGLQDERLVVPAAADDGEQPPLDLVEVAALGPGEGALQLERLRRPAEPGALLEVGLGGGRVPGAAGGAGGQEVGLAPVGPLLQAEGEVGPGQGRVVPLEGAAGGPQVVVGPERPGGAVRRHAAERDQHQDQQRQPPALAAARRPGRTVRHACPLAVGRAAVAGFGRVAEAEATSGAMIAVARAVRHHPGAESGTVRSSPGKAVRPRSGRGMYSARSASGRFRVSAAVG